MSPDYVQPLIQSELANVVDQVFCENGASWLRHAAAKKFIQDFKCPPETRAYGSYKELLADADVNVVYVATPHSHHYQNVRACLEAGKNVLCEKAFTVNAAQARKLTELAKEKGLCLMEAVW